ncbi:rhomboid family intramembrane serine protease [Terriglobus saanensis]|uniref:Rhomboid family protein n=1 Tax=Terriglobus saanensis (strain ATCC BAA-1853 / DSM 23119 / SP1PR4) TaxID=401053 RepID=E8V826_TERSS|nr:rhomboid family intramembrane serine protease [Terriglobus saanensis]ADV84008.1 Rhomboid family protein [Terriglobus saanensis SP1PR4]
MNSSENFSMEPARPGEPAYPTGAPVVELPARRSRFAGVKLSPATYLLLGINIAVFLWMGYRGADLRLPSLADLIRFGANNSDLVIVHGQWWRIISAMFVHVGLIHLATNMWCLWNLGLLGEPLLGFFGMISVYLLSGAAGNLLSIAWDVIWKQHGQVGAGASGAVFGIAGILIVLLSNKRLSESRGGRPGIPWMELRALRKSVIQFAGLNLAIGLASIFFDVVRIDNSAHIGGFVCGLAMGVPLLPEMTSGRVKYLERQKVAFLGFALLLSLFGYFISRL